MENDYGLILERYDAENRFRKIPSDRTDSPLIDLVSNDYLGLGARWKDFLPEFQHRFPDASFSSSASRLLSQRQVDFFHLENLLETLYNKSILLFNSGYHANVGITQSLNIPGTLFLSDKLIHASMIDGLRLASADYHIWSHNDIDSLKELLNKHSDRPRCVVMLESIYSMDGDISPLREIVDLKKLFPNMIIYLDEAHGFGCFGNKGLGLAEELGILDEIDILVGTLGKAAASCGAFVATSETMKHYFINSARSFIFSTAIPPVNIAWSRLMIEHIIMMTDEREHLKRISDLFREGIEEITGMQNPSRSQIIPLMIGDAEQALHVASRLTLKGVDALAIRRPSVPPGGERIRFSLSAKLSEREINQILQKIKECL